MAIRAGSGKPISIITTRRLPLDVRISLSLAIRAAGPLKHITGAPLRATPSILPYLTRIGVRLKFRVDNPGRLRVHPETGKFAYNPAMRILSTGIIGMFR
jgi:hypothetical protein